MLYLIGWKLFDIIYIFFGLMLLCVIFSLRWIVRRKLMKINVLKNNNSSSVLLTILLIVLLILVAMIALGIGEKAYGIYMYHEGKYETVEGQVENYEYIYENNSDTIRGICFSVSGVKFNINNGVLNAGYSYKDKIITQNSDQFKIYYVKPLYGDVSYIIRIDSIE